MSDMAAPAAGISGIIDPEVLDCTICFDPLQPPVFQCAVGHVICSPCQGKLINKENCNTCSLPGGYNRCYALEKILESLRIPCANAAYGCTVKTHYHEVEDHGKSCPHAPCFCPEPGCNFAGSTVALLAHLTGGHMWPSTELEYNVKLTLEVKAGVHVLHRRDRSPFFLVKFTPAPPPYGSAASVLCVDPDATATMEKGRKFRCQLGSSNVDMDWQQYSRFQVRSTTLSDGWPPTEDGGSLYVAPSTESITVSITKIMRDICSLPARKNIRSQQLEHFCKRKSSNPDAKTFSQPRMGESTKKQHISTM
ncbi:hypothetical protein CFC21_039356 [Triticum aestivum]|uniref:RING-type E3 ubiquitin transferase n=3 Tax=Triticum aestivum TaxID=4565 RepID=A0A9R1FEL4_WHEAT|nr:hypothetical protein CFC21_039356 [Triticum aestivum]CDM80812.1 unnamed protein product [Triticum aestivum]